MTAVPVTRTWVAGEVVLDSHFNNNIRDVLNFLLAPPIVQARQTVAQSLTNGVFADLTFTTEDVDSAGMHSNVTNTPRFTAVYAGWYRYSGSAAFAASATGRRLTKWSLNGSDIAGSGLYLPATAASVQSMPAKTMLIFQNVSDFVILAAAQESGGSINTAVGSVDQSVVNAKWESN